jgi:hypothetical protein
MTGLGDTRRHVLILPAAGDSPWKHPQPIGVERDTVGEDPVGGGLRRRSPGSI